MDLKDYKYQSGDMAAFICVEHYLLDHGFQESLAELQSYKPLIVYDYLKKNGYEQMAEVFLEKSTKMKRKREEQVEPNPPKRAKQDQEPSQSDSEEEEWITVDISD